MCLLPNTILFGRDLRKILDEIYKIKFWEFSGRHQVALEVPKIKKGQTYDKEPLFTDTQNIFYVPKERNTEMMAGVATPAR